ncbi:hypothetical protein [Methylobacterium sp. WL120]|uniref:hypothetical protein n=1 Tax=Methylobacterium sp. WL120 TaxID=2603887 RepID=UPI0011CB8279|nr:hypothetical protein [Methylobacterium sp. WL120]TXM68310.1 hypothetical protein FV229_08040 [Methylobacterium sp. WL120]
MQARIFMNTKVAVSHIHAGLFNYDVVTRTYQNEDGKLVVMDDWIRDEHQHEEDSPTAQASIARDVERQRRIADVEAFRKAVA